MTTRRPKVLFVAADESRHAAALDALGAAYDVTAFSAREGDESPTDGSVDCVVLADETLRVPEFASGAPLVLYTERSLPALEESPTVAGCARWGAVETLVDAVAAVDRERNERDRIDDLHDATADLLAAESPSDLYERTATIASRVLSFDHHYLGIVEDGAFRTKAATATYTGPVPIDSGILGHTYRTGESSLVPDVAADDLAEPYSPEYRSAISVPFGDRGVFQALSTDVGAFDETDVALCELLVSYAVGTLARIESEAALRESRSRVRLLHKGTTELVSLREEETVYRRMADIADSVLSFSRCAVMTVDESGELLVPAAMSSGAEADDARPLPVSEGIGGYCYRTGRSRLVRDVVDEEDANPAKAEYRSGLSVPVGEWGVFQAVAVEPNAFDETDLELAELLASHVAETIARIHADEEFRTERDRLGALFENVPDAAVGYEFVAGEPRVVRVNSAFEEIFGYDSEEIVGENVDSYILPPSADARREAGDLNRQLRTGQNVRVDVTRMTVDGPREFLLHVIPLHLDAENATGYAIYTDVTDRKERQRELERQNRRLDEFASIVSHDLRNPLNVAAGYLELWRETGEEDYLEKVDDAVDRMDALLDDLLSLARKGEDVGSVDDLDLEAVVRRAWDNVDTGEASLRVGETRTLRGDRSRVLALFENLFRNAVEHGRSDAVVQVGALSYRDESLGGFYVGDDGPGIDPADREAVFEAGHTTNDAGTGLGLAITKRIAEAHGWSVRVVRGEGGGARFEFQTE